MEKVMPIERVIGDVLDAQTEGLVVGCDGDHPKKMGAVGYQLKKRLDDDLEWSRIIEKAKFPIAPGCVNIVDVMEIPEIGFRYLMFVNFYNHKNADVYLGMGYFNVVGIAHNWEMRTIATPLHRGGWRTAYSDDIAMKELKRSSDRWPDVIVRLYERPPRVKDS